MKKQITLFSITLVMLALLVTVSPAYADMIIGQPEGHPFFITMNGSSVVPGPGAPNAVGEAKLVLMTNEQGLGDICYTIRVSSNAGTPTFAYIYAGKTGVAGTLAVNLNVTFDARGVAKGCTLPLAKKVIKAIRQDPTGYYLQVLTAAGGVRGQLSKK